VRTREADQDLVREVFPDALVAYKQETGKELNLKLDTDTFLPAEICGGVDLFAQGGRIKISNTLESRLDLIAQQLIPQIRTALFGRNPSRKFTN
jgi:V-type H+-transporting ATPase subunit E